MAVWLVRAGAKGEHEQKFLEEGKIYLTKGKIDFNVALFNDRAELIEQMKTCYDPDKPRRITNHASQVWPFAHSMQLEDLIILPSKQQPAVYVGRISSAYHYDKTAQAPYYHYRQVKWREQPVPRMNFAKDILNSFSAFMTVCQIRRNDAESRLEQMALHDWQSEHGLGSQ